jgi:hypothetical protein
MCPQCSREYLRRRLEAVRDHGDLRSALHLVCRPPPEAGPWTLAGLSEFKSASVENARRALLKAFGTDPRSLNALGTLHPCGTVDHSKAGPHFDGFAAAEALDGILTPALDAAVTAATEKAGRQLTVKEARRARRCGERALLRLFMVEFRRLQHRTVERLAGHPVRVPRTFARWYGESVELHLALEDALRGDEFSGWNLDTRVSVSGPWRKLPKLDERPTRPARGLAGAVPVETVREGGDWNRLTPEERGYYERSEGEAEARAADEEVLATSYTADEVESWSVVVDLSHARPLLLDDPIGIAVRHADKAVEMSLRRIAKKRRALVQHLPIRPHPSIRNEIEALCRDVERRRTPSSRGAAAWLLEALGGDFERTAPLGISGLLACSELKWLHRQLRDLLAHTKLGAA